MRRSLCGPLFKSVPIGKKTHKWGLLNIWLVTYKQKRGLNREKVMLKEIFLLRTWPSEFQKRFLYGTQNKSRNKPQISQYEFIKWSVLLSPLIIYILLIIQKSWLWRESLAHANSRTHCVLKLFKTLNHCFEKLFFISFIFIPHKYG